MRTYVQLFLLPSERFALQHLSMLTACEGSFHTSPSFVPTLYLCLLLRCYDSFAFWIHTVADESLRDYCTGFPSWRLASLKPPHLVKNPNPKPQRI
jgi:hypothetical protein